MPRSEWQMWSGESGLDPSSCLDIIDRCLALPQEQGTIGAGAVNRDIRSADVRGIPNDHPDFSELFQKVDYYCRLANRNAFGLDLSWLPNLSFTTYRAADGGKYTRHMDLFWEDGHRVAETDRKVSMVMQLSNPDDYEGGDLQLEVRTAPDPAALRARGTMIFFPSFIYHRVTPITRGLRYSLVAWYEGPRFR